MSAATPPLPPPGLLGQLGRMTSIRDTGLLEQSLLKTLVPLLGTPDAMLYRVDEGGAIVRAIRLQRARTRVAEVDESLEAGEIPAEVLALTDEVRRTRRPGTRAHGGGWLSAYPLTGDSRVCGYFVFRRARRTSPAEDATIRGVLEVFANYYALLDTSQRDRLTGLYNRQALEGGFERLWAALAQSGPPRGGAERRGGQSPRHYWLAVIDIDHFKRVNDSYGHLVGDEVLLLAARLLTQTFRASDLLYRYGGEEFVAIIGAEDDATARRVFERVRAVVAAQTFPRAGRLTVSIGYCRADPAVLPQEVLGRADRSLYEAKKAGRNRVCDYADLVRRGVVREIGYGESELF